MSKATKPHQIDDALLLPSEVADYLRVTVRQVTERYAMRPDFPKPVLLPSPTGAAPRKRWRKSEVLQWLEGFQQKAA